MDVRAAANLVIRSIIKIVENKKDRELWRHFENLSIKETKAPSKNIQTQKLKIEFFSQFIKRKNLYSNSIVM